MGLWMDDRGIPSMNQSIAGGVTDSTRHRDLVGLRSWRWWSRRKRVRRLRWYAG